MTTSKRAPKKAPKKKAPGVGRGEVSWATVAHELERLVREGAPTWMDPDTLAVAKKLARFLEQDALRATEELNVADAARALGTGERTLKRWRADGWPSARRALASLASGASEPVRQP